MESQFKLLTLPVIFLAWPGAPRRCAACKSLEDGMSLCSKLRKGQVAVGLLIALAVSLLSSPALAQSDANPKWDLFLGYQWLHPGGSVPHCRWRPEPPQPHSKCQICRRAAVPPLLIILIGIGVGNSIGARAAGGNSSMPDAHETTFSVGPALHGAHRHRGFSSCMGW